VCSVCSVEVALSTVVPVVLLGVVVVLLVRSVGVVGSFLFPLLCVVMVVSFCMLVVRLYCIVASVGSVVFRLCVRLGMRDTLGVLCVG